MCPERKTALIARELDKYNIDIAALTETHLSDCGELCENQGGYTYYWIGKPSTERASSGVGFAIKTSLAQSLTEKPKGITDRLMTLKLHTSANKFLHLITAYSPTMMYSDEAKFQFYDDLRSVLQGIPANDKIVLMGDFNARVGTEHNIWKDVLGRHGVGKCNSNGELLLSLCAEFNLSITNTYFRLSEKYKTSWMHPRSKHWHLIDYIIVRRADLKDVLITRAMRGALGWTDHRLIRSKVCLYYKPPRRAKHIVPTRMAFAKLVNSETVQKCFHSEFSTKTFEKEVSIEKHWHNLSQLLYDVAQRVVGKTSKKNQDWFDESDLEIMKLINNSRRVLQDPSSTAQQKALQHELKSKVRELKDRWWTMKALELQHLADTKQSGLFFESLKSIFGPKYKKISPIYNRDKSRQLTDHNEVLNRWSEHFSDILNPPSHGVDLAYIDSLEALPISSELDKEPTFEEFVSAVNKLKNGKATGLDTLPAELYKYGGECVQKSLFELITRIWQSGVVPQEWKDATICKLYKGKGDSSDCGSYRGIALLSAAGKVLAHIINQRLSALSERILSESQCGFRPGRGTVDAIFVVKQLQEKCLEQHRSLNMCFVDLEKAFDRVPRSALWTVLSKAGCPDKLLLLIRQFHDGMTARVQHENDLTSHISVTSGVKQGCVMAPTLFAVYFAAVLKHSYNEPIGQIILSVRCGKSVFDLSRFRAKRSVQELSLLDVLYADDVCLMANDVSSLQMFLDNLDRSCRRFGLVISVSKSQVLKQPARGTTSDPTPIYLGGRTLEEVSSFKYLGSSVRTDNKLETEISSRIARAAASFGKLRHRVWDSHDIRLRTKISVYKAIILPILLYATETWCLYKADIGRLDSFHIKCLRSILHVKWQDRISSTEVLRRTKLSGVEAMLIQRQLRWCGHVVRMKDTRMPKAVFYSQLKDGKRKSGGQFLRYRDVLKRHLSACDIPSDGWEDLALQRREWRNSIDKAVAAFETQRVEHSDEQRLIKKNRPKIAYNYTYDSSGRLYCAPCKRLFKTKFGFASHLCSHSRT
ncbi:hypothetical protein K1T71_001463 [Dendrolimus kikuchii]|uniref:Uncharacterized protein n=1 Tax=Dendrolimus kikuchii TaxID=765133 RepID=A0ACC1DJ98_9NEOP|nr:hypothetical protein K1T71_001463 [Dendrolimus kikuchii]